MRRLVTVNANRQTLVSCAALGAEQPEFLSRWQCLGRLLLHEPVALCPACAFLFSRVHHPCYPLGGLAEPEHPE